MTSAASWTVAVVAGPSATTAGPPAATTAGGGAPSATTAPAEVGSQYEIEQIVALQPASTISRLPHPTILRRRFICPAKSPTRVKSVSLLCHMLAQCWAFGCCAFNTRDIILKPNRANAAILLFGLLFLATPSSLPRRRPTSGRELNLTCAEAQPQRPWRSRDPGREGRASQCLRNRRHDPALAPRRPTTSQLSDSPRGSVSRAQCAP